MSLKVTVSLVLPSFEIERLYAALTDAYSNPHPPVTVLPKGVRQKQPLRLFALCLNFIIS
ncbi:hypothetical protein [Nostoc linckia]|uniref:hypothetical protein n=1 Tax=Nostoc linckia TaxID=92942 RepID=UPI00117C7661|nr:hypothetical protein [Nostoc linckia]